MCRHNGGHSSTFRVILRRPLFDYERRTQSQVGHGRLLPLEQTQIKKSKPLRVYVGYRYCADTIPQIPTP